MASINIFIPVYNGEKYLSRTLDCVLGQSFGDLEVFCVDDGSSDDSYALLQKYASRDPRVRLFQKPNGGSVPPSWVFVIPKIDGDFVLYMSQDDILLPETLEKLVKRQRETGADAVLPHEIHYYEGLPDNKQHHLLGINGDVTPILSGKEAFRLMIDYSISGRALWSSRVVREIGMPADTYNADELAQRLWALNCQKVAFSDAVFLYCRDNPNAITTKHSPRHYDNCLTTALLLQLTEKVFPYDTELLQSMANGYYDYLLKMYMVFFQRKDTYTPEERSRSKEMLHKAYQIIHHRHSLKGKKNRISSICFPAFLAVASYKALKYLRLGIMLEDNFDALPYTAINKWKQPNDFAQNTTSF